MSAFANTYKIKLTSAKGLYASDDAANERIRSLNNSIKGVRNQNINPDQREANVRTLQTERDRQINAVSTNYSIEFDVLPDVTESGSAEYADISDIRAPASIMYYVGSPSRTFSINAKLISRTKAEARENALKRDILKSWRVPESTVGGFGLNPPTILYLHGFGSTFKSIPVVMTDIQIEYSSEHDFITAGEGPDSPVVPIIMPISISLKEAQAVYGGSSPESFAGLEKFNILDYRLGRLKGW